MSPHTRKSKRCRKKQRTKRERAKGKADLRAAFVQLDEYEKYIEMYWHDYQYRR